MTLDEPFPLPAWIGGAEATPRSLAEIWGTVDLDRALAAFGADAHGRPDGSADGYPGDIGGPAAPDAHRDALADPLLGARVLLLPARGGRRIALAEPSTEGRLAATLARHGEGVVGAYVEMPVDLEAIRARAAAAKIVLSRSGAGPFGRSVLVVPGAVGGRLLILVERAAVPSRP